MASLITIDDMVLKNVSEQKFKASGCNEYTITTKTSTRMYKRTQFSISYQISGIQAYYAAQYKPGITQASKSIKCQGLSTKDAFFWYDDYYTVIKTGCEGALSTIFEPEATLLMSTQESTESGTNEAYYVDTTDLTITYPFKEAS